MVNLIFLGAPGAGKGTQAQELKRLFGFEHISTGELLRKKKQSQDEISHKIRMYMDRGELVPDKIVFEVLRQAINENNVKGFIFDGFPRNLTQAKELEKLLEGNGMGLHKVLFFDVSRDVSVQRLSGRRVCNKCGANFHIENMPPKKEGVCDFCGGVLMQRKDDTPEVIEQRWMSFYEQTKPLIDYYQEKGLLERVDANLARQETFKNVLKVVESIKDDSAELFTRNRDA